MMKVLSLLASAVILEEVAVQDSVKGSEVKTGAMAVRKRMRENIRKEIEKMAVGNFLCQNISGTFNIFLK